MDGVLERLLRLFAFGANTGPKEDVQRRIICGVMASVTLHLLVLGLILSSNQAVHLGTHSLSADGGVTAADASLRSVSLTLVSQVEPSAQVAAARAGAQSPPWPADASPVGVASALADSSQKSQGTGHSDNDTANPMEQSDAATTDSRVVMATASQAADGATDGTDALLSQIARCLPQGVRPALAGVRLDLSLDDKGDLIAAPRLEMDVEKSTRDQILAANQIVQAALQCGPYVLPQASPKVFALAADFAGADAVVSQMPSGLSAR